MSVEADFRSFLLLTTASVATTNCFIGPFRKKSGVVPAPAVHVMEYWGGNPNQFMTGGLTDTYRRAAVQVKIRGGINGYVAAKALADAVWKALDHPSNVTLTGVSGGSRQYVYVRPIQSGPIYIGQNDVEQDEFIINVRAEYGGNPVPPAFITVDSAFSTFQGASGEYWAIVGRLGAASDAGDITITYGTDEARAPVGEGIYVGCIGPGGAGGESIDGAAGGGGGAGAVIPAALPLAAPTGSKITWAPSGPGSVGLKNPTLVASLVAGAGGAGGTADDPGADGGTATATGLWALPATARGGGGGGGGTNTVGGAGGSPSGKNGGDGSTSSGGGGGGTGTNATNGANGATDVGGSGGTGGNGLFALVSHTLAPAGLSTAVFAWAAAQGLTLGNTWPSGGGGGGTAQSGEGGDSGAGVGGDSGSSPTAATAPGSGGGGAGSAGGTGAAGGARLVFVAWRTAPP